MRSASTTPRSLRGTDPDDYDRVWELPQWVPKKTVRFGEGYATEFEVDQEVLTTQITWMKPGKNQFRTVDVFKSPLPELPLLSHQ